jgi:hypothetical protein
MFSAKKNPGPHNTIRDIPFLSADVAQGTTLPTVSNLCQATEKPAHSDRFSGSLIYFVPERKILVFVRALLVQAGLLTCGSLYLLPLPGISASGFIAAFVPAHSRGPVPDSHRVPSLAQRMST